MIRVGGLTGPVFWMHPESEERTRLKRQDPMWYWAPDTMGSDKMGYT